MNQIKAIETRYKGYRFRSRLEARWAVFFDALGLLWEYEPEGFLVADNWMKPDDLEESEVWDVKTNHTPYLPDFRLPDLGCWCEVKGVLDIGNLKLLCDASVMHWGLPTVREEINGNALLILGSISQHGHLPTGVMLQWHKGNVIVGEYYFDHFSHYVDISLFDEQFVTIYGDNGDFDQRVAARVLAVVNTARSWRVGNNHQTCHAAELARGARFEHGECGALA